MTDPGAAPVGCPLCGHVPMKERAAGKSSGASRRCPVCLAEFRERPLGQWALEYVDPDLFHRIARTGSGERPPLLRSRPWSQWGNGDRKAAPLERGPAAPPDLAPGETVREQVEGVRVVNPNSHHPQHSEGPTGTLWITDRALHVHVGSFRWSAPLGELRGCRDAGGILEVLAGPTDEPLHLVVPKAGELASRLRQPGPSSKNL